MCSMHFINVLKQYSTVCPKLNGRNCVSLISYSKFSTVTTVLCCLYSFWHCLN